MKKLRAEELIPGMITAEDIYNYNDQLVLPKGLVLTEKAISKLQFYAVYQVHHILIHPHLVRVVWESADMRGREVNHTVTVGLVPFLLGGEKAIY